MKATTEFWQNNLVEIHRALVRDCGCKGKITYHRDANGDYDRIETFYATLRAELVDRDLELVVDVTDEPEKGRLDGLSISAFRGFRDAAKGEDNAFAFAVFENGRALRVLHWKTPLVSDPAERTARELQHQRIKGATTAAPAPPPEPLTLSAALLLEIAEKCAKELHPRATKQPYHWDVFLAAWKDGQSTRDMERRRKWKRSTCRLRLHEIETELLHGCKIASFKFDDSAFKEVQRSLAAGRKHGAFIRAGALLENEYDREEDY